MKEFIYPVIVLFLAVLLILTVLSKNDKISKLEQENQKYFDALVSCLITKVSDEKRVRY
jgi:hypothetical protein